MHYWVKVTLLQIILLGESLRLLDQYEESIRFYDKALVIDPNNENALSSKGNRSDY